MEYEVMAGTDNVIGFGEQGLMTLHLTNLNPFAIGTTNLNLSSTDPYFELITTQSSFAGLQSGESITLENAFSFNVDEQVPDGYLSTFTLNATAAEGTWTRSLSLTAYRATMEIAAITVLDGNNGILDPGETAQIAINLRNAGGAGLTNATAGIASFDQYLSILSGSGTEDTLNPGEIWNLVFEVSLAPETPLYHLIEINLAVTGDYQYQYMKTIPFFTGLLVENFETGSFTTFEWETGGDAPWYPEENNAYEGDWCSRSGVIQDNELSSLSINWNVAFADTVSFWFKVSSEAGYDFLHFSGKDGELGKWAGTWDWTNAKFAVNAGEHPFAWQYIKDYSVSNGEDCARVDYIILPVFSIPTALDQQKPIAARFSVYPNPGREEMNISYTLNEPSPVYISICDIHGRILYDYEQNSTIAAGEYILKPDFQESGPGVYTVLLRTNSGILVKKIIRTAN